MGCPGAIERVKWQPEVALVTRPADRVIVTIADPGMAAFLSACDEVSRWVTRPARPMKRAAMWHGSSPH